MKQHDRIRVMIADDHSIFRRGLGTIIAADDAMELTGEADNGRQLVNLVRKHSPDVVLTDIRMPFLDGITAVQEIKAFAPDTEFVILAANVDDTHIRQLFAAGAKACLLKNALPEEILKAIYTVHQKGFYSCRGTTGIMAGMVVNSPAAPTETLPQLSEREKIILQMTCENKNSKEIAAKIFLGNRTVQRLRANLMRRLQLHNISEVVKFALKQGLIG